MQPVSITINLSVGDLEAAEAVARHIGVELPELARDRLLAAVEDMTNRPDADYNAIVLEDIRQDRLTGHHPLSLIPAFA